MSGFWAGAVPPWAYVVGALGCFAFLLTGMWVGYGRGWEHAKEDDQWAREQAKARRTHPVYRQPYQPVYAREDGTIALAIDPVMPEPAITTGEIQAITDEMDAWLAVHVYGAPADYGQWLEQQEDR